MTQLHWHTLKKKKPEDGQYCLLTLPDKFVNLVPAKVFEYESKSGEFIEVVDSDFMEADVYPPNRILAWMPLPQPFQEK